MNLIRHICVFVQAATFIPLFVVFMAQGQPRLAIAQLLLGGVTMLVYL